MTLSNYFKHTGSPHPPEKMYIHTSTADSAVLKRKCILRNAAFIIIQSVCLHFFWGGHPIAAVIIVAYIYIF